MAGSVEDFVAELLLRPEPDIPEAVQAIQRQFAVDEAQAGAIVRFTASQVNRKAFHPITELELIHTEGCNLGCTYCFEREMLGYRRMPEGVALAAVDLLFEYAAGVGPLTITHFGGEPMLNFPSIVRSTEHALALAARTGKEVAFRMTSNGTLLPDEALEYCARRKIQILISVDGMRDSHDRYRKDKHGQGTFDRVIAGLARLRKTQAWVGVKMTVMPENVPALLSDVVGLRDYGVNQFIIGHATGVPWPEPAMQAYGEQLSRVFSWYQANKGPDLRIDEFDAAAGDGPLFGCQAGRNSIAVAVDGTISPCSKILGLGTRKPLLKLGDVRFGITNVLTRLELHTCGTLKAECQTAGIEGEFAGGCFASNYSDNGHVFSPSLQDHRISLINRTVCAGCSAKH